MESSIQTEVENIAQPVKPSKSWGKLVISLFAGIFIGYGIFFSISSTKQPTNTNLPLPTQSPTPTAEQTPIPTLIQTTQPAVPEQPVKIGNTSVTLPLGWRISAFLSHSADMTKQEKTMYLKDEYTEGMFPLSKEKLVQLTNGRSTINIKEKGEIIAGPFGFVPNAIPSSWVIVQKPSKDKNGLARSQDGNTYQFHEIFVCEDKEMCGEYGTTGEIGLGTYVSFVGDSKDLNIADKFYIDTFLNKEFTFGK